MKEESDLPGAGSLLIVVRFRGYERTFTNDVRRRILKWLPQLDKEMGLGLGILPVQFAIIRSVAGGITRGSGAIWQFSFVNMDQEKMDKIIQELTKLARTYEWWKKVEVSIAQTVGEISG